MYGYYLKLRILIKKINLNKLIGIYLKHGREKKSTKGLLVFTPTHIISYHHLFLPPYPFPS
jgi:hypothetical protein